MGEIRSAREIATEKASQLGELSREERTRQSTEICEARGKGMARKYITEGDLRSIDHELHKIESEHILLVRKAALCELISMLHFTAMDQWDMLLKGIMRLQDVGKIGVKVDRLELLRKDYKDAMDRQVKKISPEVEKILDKQGISGTAIGKVNAFARKEWCDMLKVIEIKYEKKLEIVRLELLAEAV